MIQVGIIGARGMVGSTLLDRMRAENDCHDLDITFFSTSQSGSPAPVINACHKNYECAFDMTQLANMDIIICTQGSQYTETVHPKLRNRVWSGYWIDAASHLRMKHNSIITLDPINRQSIDCGLKSGIKDFIGSNCTVSLMLMAIAGLVENNLVRSIQATTYQAISGAGANAITELVEQLRTASQTAPHKRGIDLANALHHHLADVKLLKDTLAMNILPWIDSPMQNGQTKEEWKAMAETNKILNTQNNPIPIDSTCVRTPTLRSHSQSLFIELEQPVSPVEVERLIQNAHSWVTVVPNTQDESLANLNPIACANDLTIKVGRIRQTYKGNRHIQLFTTGDQLLWGAAEPLRRTLKIIVAHILSTVSKKTATPIL